METNIYKIFLASPGDTIRERAIVGKIVEEINSTTGEHYNFTLKLLTWENDSFPDFGEDGQDVINRQLGLDYDIFIGIMWKKFGTPTSRAESGTQEEFQRAYEKYKEHGNLKIMFYFNTAPIPQDQLDTLQFEKVKLFKKSLPGLGGLYWSYDSLEAFELNLRKHLQKHILSIATSPKDVKESSKQTSQQMSLVPV